MSENLSNADESSDQRSSSSATDAWGGADTRRSTSDQSPHPLASNATYNKRNKFKYYFTTD